MKCKTTFEFSVSNISVTLDGYDDDENYEKALKFIEERYSLSNNSIDFVGAREKVRRDYDRVSTIG